MEGVHSALILGAGRSGQAAARLLARLGAQPTLLDEQRGDDGSRLPEGHYGLAVVSPAIPMAHPWIGDAKAKGIPLISELEFGARHWRGEAIALTGSKGKSSAVKCLADTLNLAGRPAVTAGNYGIPLCERVLDCPEDGRGIIAVVEVSSFQMEHTATFAPHLAALLNLQADHLDRHTSMEEYAALKYRLFQAQRPGRDMAFLPEGLPATAIPQGVAIQRFGMSAQADWRFEPGRLLGPAGVILLQGYFNNEVLGRAAALVAAMLSALGLSSSDIARGFAAFEPLPHRMQSLGEFQGRAFIDDSKATSLAATEAALRMAPAPVRLIAGGLLKETALDFPVPTLRQRAKGVYLIGKAQDALWQAWRTALPCARCGDMETAVQQAFADSAPGETILLSPGCASFDQYPGMGARGDHFRRCMEALAAHD